jgi:hypothetical protein
VRAERRNCTLSDILSTLPQQYSHPPPPPPARSKISLVVLGVDDGTLPLASRHVAVEQDVDLAVGAALHLWDVVVGQDQAKECRACPNIAAFAAEVSALCGLSLSAICWREDLGRIKRTYLWVEHVTRQEDTRDVDQVVATSSDTRGKGSESDGRGFANDHP